MSNQFRFVALGLALLGSTANGCAPTAPDSVVIVMVDTLRADHLGAYGYWRDTSPIFDDFAAESVLFRQARSQASCTFPSVNSILTSRPPLEFLGQTEGRVGISEKVDYLPEILSQAGRRTLAVSASPVVRKSPSRWNPEGGFDRGFDEFDETCESRNAECVLDVARSLLESVGEASFFLYVHFYDPHEPYRPPSHHERRFAGSYKGRFGFVRGGNVYPVAAQIERSGKTRLDTPALEHLVDLYDEEIGYWDHQFGRLLQALEELRLDERTVVALVSDHGESFLEHGKIAHCRTLYDPEIHIPLVVRSPGGPKAVEISSTVSALDLTPTILDLLDVSSPARANMVGRSLRPLWEDDPESRAPSFALSGRWRSATSDRFKLLLDISEDRQELFDLREDPLERVNVIDRYPGRAEGLRREILRWIRAQEQDSETADSAGLAEREQERLRAVGYLQ